MQNKTDVFCPENPFIELTLELTDEIERRSLGVDHFRQGQHRPDRQRMLLPVINVSIADTKPKCFHNLLYLSVH